MAVEAFFTAQVAPEARPPSAAKPVSITVNVVLDLVGAEIMTSSPTR